VVICAIIDARRPLFVGERGVAWEGGGQVKREATPKAEIFEQLGSERPKPGADLLWYGMGTPILPETWAWASASLEQSLSRHSPLWRFLIYIFLTWGAGFGFGIGKAKQSPRRVFRI